MVLILKKEISKTAGSVEQEDTGKYCQLLVRTLHSACIKFPDVANTVIPLLMEFLSDTNELAAMDVLIFVREAMNRFQNLRPVMIEKLLEAFSCIKGVKIHRAALWILGEYCERGQDMQALLSEVRQSLGEIPIVDDELKKAAGEEENTDESVAAVTGGNVTKVMNGDGTYATQSAFSQGGPDSAKKLKDKERPPLRKYLIEGDFFIGAALAGTLTKLALRWDGLVKDEAKQNRFTAECMLIIASILRLGTSGLPEKPITKDDEDRLQLCLKVLADKTGLLSTVFNTDCREALGQMLEAQVQVEGTNTGMEKKVVSIQPDSPINFLQLSKLDSLVGAGDILDISLNQALGTGRISKADFASSKLNKVTQLTGFSDPVYAEAYVNVNQYDIVLDVLIVNQTRDTLQACTLELATLGDLKLVEKPQPFVLAPNDFANIKANVKVASTENGIIFGNIVYDVAGSTSDRNVVVLNDIHIDIMDYIVPASCTETEFRSMWAEFEWENKVSVNTTLTDLMAYLSSLLASTNMKCLTPDKALQGECGFMAANLYAKSIFGEDALANVSLEKNLSKPDAPVTGHIRIRAKSQGMALSLGDKINICQKTRQKKPVATQG